MSSLLALIERKRDGQVLSSDEWRAVSEAAARGSAPDYQIAALLMACYLRGLEPQETRDLTLAVRDSGDVLRWPDDPRPVADKHSTGGVGDKISLPLAPLLACLGMRVPMVSGRGLGITGGTLDKLESIPGFRARLAPDEMMAIVQDVGCVICGQTDRTAPADRTLYALRDATGTVPSIPLITSSIMGKKLSEGLNALVLDVKFGRAAFMPTLEAARELAQMMCEVGKECGVQTHALLTAMDAPLGRACGNLLEVRESVQVLEGHGPDDVTQLVIELAAHLLEQTGLSETIAESRQRATDCLASGAPLQKWREMLTAQGADVDALDALLQRETTAGAVCEVHSPLSDYVRDCDAREVGELVRDLGGGRKTKDDAVDFAVGVSDLKQAGERVSEGELLGRVHARTEEEAEAGAERLFAAFSLGDTPPNLPSLVREVVRVS